MGTLGVVDVDVVEESNLQRQIIHGTSDIGRPKVHSARDAIAELNPLVSVRLHEYGLAPDNAVELFTEYDLILDGTDNFATRYLVNDAAVLAHKPYVWGLIYRFEGRSRCSGRTPRRRRRQQTRAELPRPVSGAATAGPGAVLRRGRVLGVLCGSIASVMGTEAIKLITGIGEPLLGRLLIYDALAMTYGPSPCARIRPPAGHRPGRLRGLLGRHRGRTRYHPAELRELLIRAPSP